MQVLLDANLDICVSDVSEGDVSGVVMQLKKNGFKNIRVVGSAANLMRVVKENPPGLLILSCYREHEAGLHLLRDLKSMREIPNFPIVPVVLEQQVASFMSVAQKYGVLEWIVHPIVPQALMGALSKISHRFEKSAEEKGLSVAKRALLAGNFSEAMVQFESLREKNKSVRTEIGLGQAWIDVKDNEKAKHYLAEAAGFDSENFIVKIAEFEALVSMSNSADLVILFVQNIASFLKESRRIPGVIEVFLKQRKPAIGISVLEKFGKSWMQQEPKLVRFLWARCHFEVGELEKANALLLQAEQETQCGLEEYNLLGIVASRLGKWELAKNYYLEASAFDKNDYRLIFNIALVLEKQEKWEEAAKYLRTCLKIAPGFQKAIDRLALIEQKESGKA